MHSMSKIAESTWLWVYREFKDIYMRAMMMSTPKTLRSGIIYRITTMIKLYRSKLALTQTI